MIAVALITIVLSLVALVVTVIGFFASLKFYRDGMAMQGSAQNALGKIEERASAIQTQVGGMFDKTLDAALGRVSPQEAERNQRQMLRNSRGVAAPELAAEANEAGVTGFAEDSEVTKTTHKYYVFRGLRLSDVGEEDAAAVFKLGSAGGFNLFDGTSGIVFFGFFIGLDPAEVVARTRVLLNNVGMAYFRLAEASDAKLRERGERILDQIAIEILVEDGVDLDRWKRKINEYQPKVRQVCVELHTPSELEAAVGAEMRKMTP